MKFLPTFGVVLAVGITGLLVSACHDDATGPSTPPPSFVTATTTPTFSPAPSPTPHQATARKVTTHRATVRPTPRRTTQTPTSGVIMCRDGSVSHAQHRQGACSHHGGIA
jgi:hypothetical protein